MALKAPGCLQAVGGSPFYGKLLAGSADSKFSTAEPFDCPISLIVSPARLNQSRPLLQSCLLISTADAFGNPVLAAATPANLSITAPAGVATDLRQIQDADSKFPF